MSVDNSTIKQTFTMNGVTTAFTLTLTSLYSEPTNIKAVRVNATGTASTLTYTTDYTVVMNVSGVGGTIYVTNAGSATDKLWVYRETSDLQNSDYEDYNQFPANTVEQDFDRRTMRSQEVKDDLARALKFSVVTANLTNSTLPTPVSGLGLVWSGTDGTLINSTLPIDSSSTLAMSAATVAQGAATSASVFAANALASQLAASASAASAASEATAAASSATFAAQAAKTVAVITITTSGTAALFDMGLATAGNLTVTTKATIADLEATVANITGLTVGTVNITNMDTVTIGSMTVLTNANINNAVIGILSATSANITNLTVGTVTITDMDTVTVGSITVTTKATIALADVTLATIGTLAITTAATANMMDMAAATAGNLLVRTSATIENLTGATVIITSTATVKLLTVSNITLSASTVSKHYTGFPNRTDTTLGWVDTTYTLALTAATDDIWIDGHLYTTNTLTLALTAPQEAATALYWFWITAPLGVPQLNCSDVAPGFDKCLVATVYWNTTTNKGILCDERHWMGRDQKTHEYLHETVGARYASGLTGTFGNTTFTIGAGEFHDEDIGYDIVAQSNATVLFKNGSDAWAWTTGTLTPYFSNGTNLIYNNGTATAATTNNRFINSFFYVTPNANNPIFIIVGTGEYTTSAAAQAAAIPSLGALPNPEFKLIYKATYKNVSGGTPTYESVTDFRTSSNLPGGYVATDHGSLTGLGDDDHTQYVAVIGTRSATVPTLSITTSATIAALSVTNATITNLTVGTLSITDMDTVTVGSITVTTNATIAALNVSGASQLNTVVITTATVTNFTASTATLTGTNQVNAATIGNLLVTTLSTIAVASIGTLFVNTSGSFALLTCGNLQVKTTCTIAAGTITNLQSGLTTVGTLLSTTTATINIASIGTLFVNTSASVALLTCGNLSVKTTATIAAAVITNLQAGPTTIGTLSIATSATIADLSAALMRSTTSTITNITTSTISVGATQIWNKLTKGILIETPGGAEDLTLFKVTSAATITEMYAIVKGTSPSVTWVIKHGTDRSGGGASVLTAGTTTTDTTTGSTVSVFSDATIAANSWVWLVTTATSGTISSLGVSINYTIDT